MKQIAKAFVAAKREFAPALKTSTNPHFKSRYADLAGCMEAVNEALLDQGIALYQETSEDSTGVTVETVFCTNQARHCEAASSTFLLANKTPRDTARHLHMPDATQLWRLAA